MVMTAILFNGAEPFEQIVNIFLIEGPMWNLVKNVQAVSEKKTLKDFTILHMYKTQGQGQTAPKILTAAKQFTILIRRCEFQPLVFIIHWENIFFNIFPIQMYGGANLPMQ